MASLERDREESPRTRRRREAQEQAPRKERPGSGALRIASAMGNAAVQRLLRSARLQRAGSAPATVDDSVEQAIQARRGGGEALDAGVGRQMGRALGDDFSDVRVHADAEADSLNKAVNADAFTTGSDIFFREGMYRPGSSGGDRLLAHELTHVTQQRGTPTGGGGMTVSSPGDASERQAADVADRVSSSAGGAGAAVARQPMEEEEEMMQPSSHLDRQPMEEEEEMMQPSPHLDRQPMEEEEELQASPHLDRQPEEEEEEELQPSPHLDRQPMEEEEEELQASPHLDRQPEEEEEEEEVAMSPHVDRRAQEAEAGAGRE